MDNKIDRRALFFFTTAVVCVALLWVTLPEFRWVGITLAIVQSLLGLLSMADHASRRRANQPSRVSR